MEVKPRVFIEEQTGYLVNEDLEPVVKVPDAVIEYLEENEKVHYVVGLMMVRLEDFMEAKIATMSQMVE